MGIFDMLNMTLDEIQEADRTVFAEIVAGEIHENYLSGGKVLPLDYYRHYGRPFNFREWEKEATGV